MIPNTEIKESMVHESIIVTTEAELNKAIATINAGAKNTTIDVQKGFTLNGNVIAITESMTIKSSNGSAIKDGGHTFLDIKNGAIVSVSLNAGGSGTNIVNGSKLKGLTCGTIANLKLQNDASLIVDSGQEFTMNAVNIMEPTASGASICGRLNNSSPIIVKQGVVDNRCSNGSGNGQINDIDLVYQSYLSINPNTVFKAGKVTVRLECSITSDGTGTLANSGELMVYGHTVMHVPGAVYGVNVGNITLLNLGTYASTITSGGTLGGTAGAVTNTSGIFDLGHAGTWNVCSYEQSDDGTLRIKLPDFNGNAPFLYVDGKATFSGGIIKISSDIYYLPKGTKDQEIMLIRAAGGLTVNNLNKIVEFTGFPPGITPSLKKKGNDLFLILTVTD